MTERFEASDLSPRLVARVGVGLAISIGIIVVAIFLFMHVLKRGAAAPVAGIEPPPPRLQVRISDDLAHLRAREKEALTTYRWLDREQQVIAIPIDRAIDLTLERGLPTRPSP